MNKKTTELSLLLLYLSGWEEEINGNPETTRCRSWLGYLYEIIKRLEKEGKIKVSDSRRVVEITEKGLSEAKVLEKKYIKEIK